MKSFDRWRLALALVALAAVAFAGAACSAGPRLSTDAAEPATVAAASAGADGAATAQRIAAQAAPAATDVPSIDVSGLGRVLVTPDLARVVLGVEVRDPSLARAQSAAADRVDAVLKLLKQSGVDEKDIRTVQYHVQPITRIDERTRRPVSDGFLVMHLLQVTFRDIKTLGPRLDQVVQAGATTIQSLQFDIADPAAAITQAREQAVADARTRAEHLARLTGVTLGKPVSISESSGPLPPQPLRAAPAAPVGAAPAPTQIEPGQSEVQVSVQIRYAIQ